MHALPQHLARPAIGTVWLASLFVIGAGANAETPLSYQRDVRPLLSDRCIVCHGPDESANVSGLRLDRAEEAYAIAPSGDGAAIVPGQPAKSLVVVRLREADATVRMPPPESHLTLAEAEIALLQRWIAEGAVYEPHWAFQPLPATVAPPPLERATWGREPLDRAIAADWPADQTPRPEASRARWLRRVTLNLTGLPPTSDELEAFLNDPSETAHHRVVDRLLASPRHGEHDAIAWLDLARYADSYGYQSDKLNTQWPYRDWVVRAINENLPYDQFLTWQVAGDLLPDATSEQRLATAFQRLHRLNNEGGAVFEEWRLENVADRVHTFGTAMLGLTLECARCHDHKYDPISTREYYALGAYFNSIDENGLYDFTEKVPSPSMLLPTADQADRLNAASQAMAEARAAFLAAEASSHGRYETWKAKQTPHRWTVPDLELSLDLGQPRKALPESRYRFTVDDKSPAPSLETVPVSDWPTAWPRPSETSEVVAMTFDGDRGLTTTGVTPFDRFNSWSAALTVKFPPPDDEARVVAHFSRGTEAGFNGWDLMLKNGHLESRLYRVWPGNALAIRTISPVPASQWHQIAATYDGSMSASGLKLYLDGEPLAVEILRDHAVKSANVPVSHGGEFIVGHRFRSRGLKDGMIQSVQVYARDLSSEELTHLIRPDLSIPPISVYRRLHDPSWQEAWQRRRSTHERFVNAEEAIVEIPIMDEMPVPRESHVLARGQYDAPTNDQTRVGRAVPSILIADGRPQPRNRLELARWLTADDHPLTARVAVNRLWTLRFGQGLVGTPEDFGLQGEMPTHASLLDRLARDFVDTGWDVKRFHRMVVLSATYRQDSATTADARAADPTNRRYLRGPSQRLAAESIRDLALAASGLIDLAVGGPPVSPYQPGGDLWRESNGMSPAYRQSVGTALARRSLYSVWKRTAPLPNMMAFDASAREVCTVTRSRTNTPLQALVLLNDPQFVEAARCLADAVLVRHDDDRDAIIDAYRRLTSETPSERTRTVLERLFDEERSAFAAYPDNAERYLAVGEITGHPDLPAPRRAAMTVVCQAIMNLDASIWSR